MRFLRSKKAEDAGDVSTIPQEAFIEVVLVAMLLLLAAAFIAFINTDARVYHLFHSKDMSLLQDAMLLSEGEVSFYYLNNDGKDAQGKMDILDYEFSPYYTTTISSVNRGYKRSKVTKSYVHFANPKTEVSPTQYLSKPSNLSFYKTDEGLTIKQDNKNILEHTQSQGQNSDNGCDQSASVQFDVNEPFYLNYDAVFDLTLFTDLLNEPYTGAEPPVNPRYYSSDTHSNFDSFINQFLENEQETKDYGVYAGIFHIQSDSHVNVYVPFGSQGDLGCSFYNKLLSKISVEEVAINLIPTSSFDDMEELSKFNYFFEVDSSANNMKAVIDIIEEVIKTEP